jgi:hypothetical protein
MNIFLPLISMPPKIFPSVGLQYYIFFGEDGRGDDGCFGDEGGDLWPLRLGECEPFGEDDRERPAFRAVTHHL